MVEAFSVKFGEKKSAFQTLWRNMQKVFDKLKFVGHVLALCEVKITLSRFWHSENIELKIEKAE